MLQASTLKFLKDIKKNNNRPWFEKNRSRYEEAKADFLGFVDRLIKEMSKFDPSLAHLNAKDCMFRINRDVRFSKDKSPYKTHLSAYFNKGGKKSNGAGYYIHIEPGKSFAAGGMWQPLPADLAKIRQEIDYSFDDWKKMISDKNFKKNFPESVRTEGSLVRPPKGYDESNPAIHFIKMKNFIVSSAFNDTQVQGKSFVKDAGTAFNAMNPLIAFLNTAIE
jgi:uncharacterized protein (TIGR02453 family)